MPRRIPKLSIATAVGEPKLIISEARWLRIGKACGRSLSNKTKCQIVASTTEFIEFETFERNAEPLSWTKEKIGSIKKAVAILTTELQGPGKGDDTLLEATNRIAWKIRACLHEGRATLRGLEELLHELSIACGLALKEIDKSEEDRIS